MLRTFLITFSCLLFSNVAISSEMGMIYALRVATKYQHFDSGQYKPLEYADPDPILIEIGFRPPIHLETAPWEVVEDVCKIEKLKSILLEIEFLDPNSSAEATFSKLMKRIVSDREKLLACDLENIAITLAQQDTLPSPGASGFISMKIISRMFSIKGRFAQIKAETTSVFSSKSFPLASPHPRMNYQEAVKIHAEKFFKQLEK